jgi:hypothetical protein
MRFIVASWEPRKHFDICGAFGSLTCVRIEGEHNELRKHTKIELCELNLNQCKINCCDALNTFNALVTAGSMTPDRSYRTKTLRSESHLA